MEPAMGYVLLLALIGAPLAAMGGVILAIATGLIHEPTAAESAARSYGVSWKKLGR